MGIPLIANSTLVLRETFLGALRSRLEDTRSLRLHASDFHTAVEQLGLSFGTKVRADSNIFSGRGGGNLVAPSACLPFWRGL